MASIYKLKRKSKKEEPSSEKQDNGFSGLLFDDAPAREEPAREKPEQEEDIKVYDREEPAKQEPVKKEVKAEEKAEKEPEEKKKKASVEDMENLFSPFDKEAGEVPQDLLDALRKPEVDSEKLDAVFTRSKGTFGADSSEEEYDEATVLLREIFGTDKAPRGKKKAAAETVAESSDEYVADHGSDEEKTRDYIAVHDGDDESTKEYSTLPIGTELPDSGEMTRTDIPPLSEEVHVSDSSAEDLYSDTYEEPDGKYERRAVLPEEYTSPEEYDEFAEHLRNRNFANLCSILWTFFAFLAVLYLESACFSGIWHPNFLKPGGIYNAIYLLVDIQLLFVSALLVLSSLAKGIKGLFQGKPNRNTVLFLLYLFPAIHAVILLVTDAKEYPLFGSVAALFACFTAVANFLDSKRLYRTFRIFGSKKEKLVAKPLDGESPEAEAFRDQLEGEPRFFSIQKGSFVDGFFRRIEERSRAERSFGWVVALSLLFSIGFAVLSYLEEPSIAEVATSFVTMSVMTLPLSSVFSMSLPFSHLSAKAEKIGSAIVSIAAAEEHAATDVVSFTDKEILPPKSVKITTIRTYGETRIDRAILYAAMIFEKLGGPLSEVFKKTISGVYEEISEDFDFKEITADGMCAAIDGKDVFVGSKEYLLSYDFGYTRDEQDEAFEAKHGKIMYMVIGTELAAKFYIRYAISKQFKKTILSLYRAGICPAVKTCDPNIDADLFRTLLKNNKIPAGIIKSCEAMKDAPVAEHCESGIVCISSIARLLKTFSICDSLRHLTRANVAMKIISLLLGMGVVLFLAYIDSMTRITGLFVIIYQLLWLIPIAIPSITE